MDRDSESGSELTYLNAAVAHGVDGVSRINKRPNYSTASSTATDDNDYTLLRTLRNSCPSWNKDSIYLFLSTLGVMVATTAERITFKMSVDRMTPHRLVLIEIIFTVSLVVYGIIVAMKRGLTNEITSQMYLFPHSKLMIMALLDTIQFSFLVLAAAGITPTMTVILLHASTPAIVFGSKFFFPTRVFTEAQMRGVYLIVFAIVVGIVQQIWAILTRGIDQSGLLSTLVYILAASLHGCSTLYKEKAIIEWMQPMDVHYLSSWLFFYQVLACLVLGPAIYIFQGVSNRNWGGFPLSSMFINIRDGWSCFFEEGAFDVNSYDDFSHQVKPYDTKYSNCEFSIWLVVVYVISNVVVLECIDRVLQSGDQVLARAASAAVFVSFLTLGVYDTQVDYGNGIMGSTIGLPDIVSIVALLIGMEYYGRDTEHSEIVSS